MPALCLTLAEESLPELERKLGLYAARVPLIEVRLDYLKQPAVPRLPVPGTVQLVATARPPREGGRWTGNEADRLALLRKAAEAGFQWLDLEHDVAPLPLPSTVRTVRSFHDFSGMPDPSRTLARLTRLPADCYKLAVRISTTRDLVNLLRWREELGPHCNVLALGMGEMGRLSRLLGGFLGNPWTYVSEDSDSPVAPGQFSLAQATRIYGLDGWSGLPELYGVLGNPVGHSRSPHLHNALFRHYGLNKLYLPIAVDELEPWFDYVAATRLPFRGFSVTIPHKLAVGRFAETADSQPASINTLTWNGRGWIPDNTDVEGFLRPLDRRCPDLAGRTAVVLGNGGVAEAVVPALRDRGMEVTVLGRNPAGSRELASRCGCAWGTLSAYGGRAFLCVNTTPVGQHPHTDGSPFTQDQLGFELIYDLVYNPPLTRLLVMAQQAGIAVISGQEMFIEQAAGQFLRWTGIDPDRGIMSRALEEVEP